MLFVGDEEGFRAKLSIGDAEGSDVAEINVRNDDGFSVGLDDDAIRLSTDEGFCDWIGTGFDTAFPVGDADKLLNRDNGEEKVRAIEFMALS